MMTQTIGELCTLNFKQISKIQVFLLLLVNQVTAFIVESSKLPE